MENIEKQMVEEYHENKYSSLLVVVVIFFCGLGVLFFVTAAIATIIMNIIGMLQ